MDYVGRVMDISGKNIFHMIRALEEICQNPLSVLEFSASREFEILPTHRDSISKLLIRHNIVQGDCLAIAPKRTAIRLLFLYSFPLQFTCT